MTKNILVTGSNGFMGKNIVSNFKRHKENNVFEIAREASYWNGEHYDKVRLDSPSSVNKVISEIEFDEIYHFAGRSSVLDSWGKPFESLVYNARMTSNLVQAVNEFSSETKLILISSSAVYARKSSAISETDPLGPDSPYGMSKLISEYETKGVKNSLVIRPFFVIGKGKRNDLLYDWINQILSFEKHNHNILEVGNIDIVRDFIPLESATKIIMQLGSTEEGIFNLGSGQPSSLREIVDILKAISGLDFEVRENVSSKIRNQDRSHVVANIDQLKRACNLSSEANLTEHIRKVFNSYAKFIGGWPEN